MSYIIYRKSNGHVIGGSMDGNAPPNTPPPELNYATVESGFARIIASLAANRVAVQGDRTATFTAGLRVRVHRSRSDRGPSSIHVVVGSNYSVPQDATVVTLNTDVPDPQPADAMNEALGYGAAYVDAAIDQFKWNGSSIVPMSQGEKDGVADAERADELVTRKRVDKQRFDDDRMTLALAGHVLDRLRRIEQAFKNAFPATPNPLMGMPFPMSNQDAVVDIKTRRDADTE